MDGQVEPAEDPHLFPQVAAAEPGRRGDRGGRGRQRGVGVAAEGGRRVLGEQPGAGREPADRAHGERRPPGPGPPQVAPEGPRRHDDEGQADEHRHEPRPRSAVDQDGRDHRAHQQAGAHPVGRRIQHEREQDRPQGEPGGDLEPGRVDHAGEEEDSRGDAEQGGAHQRGRVARAPERGQSEGQEAGAQDGAGHPDGQHGGLPVEDAAGEADERVVQRRVAPEPGEDLVGRLVGRAELGRAAGRLQGVPDEAVGGRPGGGVVGRHLDLGDDGEVLPRLADRLAGELAAGHGDGLDHLGVLVRAREQRRLAKAQEEAATASSSQVRRKKRSGPPARDGRCPGGRRAWGPTLAATDGRSPRARRGRGGRSSQFVTRIPGGASAPGATPGSRVFRRTAPVAGTVGWRVSGRNRATPSRHDVAPPPQGTERLRHRRRRRLRDRHPALPAALRPRRAGRRDGQDAGHAGVHDGRLLRAPLLVVLAPGPHRSAPRVPALRRGERGHAAAQRRGAWPSSGTRWARRVRWCSRWPTSWHRRGHRHPLPVLPALGVPRAPAPRRAGPPPRRWAARPPRRPRRTA